MRVADTKGPMPISLMMSGSYWDDDQLGRLLARELVIRRTVTTTNVHQWVSP